jgi:glycolate oxidase FAD binding subunit
MTAAPLTPTTEAELAALVGEAGEGGVSLFTEGGGTKGHFGPRATNDARRVSLGGLARVTAHDVADMILSVEAGARLRDVQALLARHEQWLPLDPPFVGAGATIGGILATGSSGPRRLGYGTIKDQLLGLRVVGAHGRVTKSGGRVVKNVSGYDLHRPQVGAFGTLGVVVEAHFKVCARPETSAVWALPCGTLADAHGLALEIGATALRPVALEALDGAAARLVRARVRTPLGADGDALVLVGIEGSRATFERHARDLASFGGRGAGVAVLVERPDAAPLWEALADLPAAQAADVRVRVGARAHDLPALLAALELDRVSTRGVVARASVGLAAVALAATTDGAPLASLIERWRRLASARGGYAVVESAPVDLVNRALLPFGTGVSTGPGPALRAAWDPRGTLNPGRMAW